MPASQGVDALALAELALAAKVQGTEYEINELHEKSPRPGGDPDDLALRSYEKSPPIDAEQNEINEETGGCTLDVVLNALAQRGGRLAADGGILRYRGPALASDDPVRTSLSTFKPEILWLLADGQLCCFCPRFLAEGDRIACDVHRDQLDATRMPWETTRGEKAA